MEIRRIVVRHEPDLERSDGGTAGKRFRYGGIQTEVVGLTHEARQISPGGDDEGAGAVKECRSLFVDLTVDPKDGEVGNGFVRIGRGVACSTVEHVHASNGEKVMINPIADLSRNGEKRGRWPDIPLSLG